MRKVYPKSELRCKSWWKKWPVARARGPLATAPCRRRGYPSVTDEERDEDARGDRERGQGDPEGGQDSLVEAGLEPGFHGVHASIDLREAGVDLLEAGLHGVEQAVEGAVVLVLGDEASTV